MGSGSDSAESDGEELQCNWFFGERGWELWALVDHQWVFIGHGDAEQDKDQRDGDSTELRDHEEDKRSSGGAPSEGKDPAEHETNEDEIEEGELSRENGDDEGWWEEFIHQQKVQDQEQRRVGWTFHPQSGMYYSRDGVWYDPTNERYFDSRSGQYYDTKTKTFYTMPTQSSTSGVTTDDGDKKKKKVKKALRKEREMRVSEKGITIGRSSLAGIRAKGRDASRMHAEIVYDAESLGFMLRDVGSRHGTECNGHRLGGANKAERGGPLQQGDSVRVGDTVITVIGTTHTAPPECRASLRISVSTLQQPTSHLDKPRAPGSFVLPVEELRRALQRDTTKPCYRDRAAERRTLHGPQPVVAPPRGLVAASSVSAHPPTYVVRATEPPPIPESNVGRKLLRAMGWKEGQGLGANEDGIAQPINPKHQRNKAGLGRESKFTDTPNDTAHLSHADATRAAFRREFGGALSEPAPSDPF